jgi:hypothetical protein
VNKRARRSRGQPSVRVARQGRASLAAGGKQPARLPKGNRAGLYDMVQKILSVQFYNILSTDNAKIIIILYTFLNFEASINYSCSLDNSILKKVKKITKMVYKIAEIKYTSCYAILYQKGKRYVHRTIINL